MLLVLAVVDGGAYNKTDRHLRFESRVLGSL